MGDLSGVVEIVVRYFVVRFQDFCHIVASFFNVDPQFVQDAELVKHVHDISFALLEVKIKNVEVPAGHPVRSELGKVDHDVLPVQRGSDNCFLLLLLFVILQEVVHDSLVLLKELNTGPLEGIMFIFDDLRVNRAAMTEK